MCKNKAREDMMDISTNRPIIPAGASPVISGVRDGKRGMNNVTPAIPDMLLKNR
jgi:hypothetical protein